MFSVITKRKNFLNVLRLQFRYVGLGIVISLISIFAGWYSCYIIMQEKLLPSFSLTLIQIYQKLAYYNLKITVLIIIPIVIVLFIFFTHRLAGSIYKIKNVLDEIADGNKQEIKIRQDDDLKDVVDSINKIINK